MVNFAENLGFSAWKSISLSAVLTAGLLLALPLGANAQEDVTLFENFRGLVAGDAVQKDGNAVFNTGDFRWEKDVRARVVSLEDAAGLPGLSSVRSVQNPKIPETLGAARTGGCESCVLRFYYPEGQNSFAEQRFKLSTEAMQRIGAQGLTEIWLQYDIFIPSNYFHRDVNPEYTSRWGGGEKLLTLFADEYSYPNPTLILGLNMLRRKSGDASYTNDGSSYQQGTHSYYQNGQRKYVFMRPDVDKPVIDVSRDLGTWQRRTLRMRVTSAEGAGDGMIELWVRHGDGSVTKVVDVQNGEFFNTSQNYINGGYLQGWSNSGFDEDTYILIDNVIITNNPANIDLSGMEVRFRPRPPSLQLN